MSNDNSIVYFIDTNIFLRTLIKEDEQTFGDCVSMLMNINNGTIKAVTSHIIIAEIVWVLQSYYRFSKTKTVLAIEGINNLRGLKYVDNFNLNLAISSFSSKNIKFIDGLIASLDEIGNREMIIVSYDKDFDKIGAIRLEPQDILKNIQ